MGDVWEEGYSLKELSKRSAMLLERKEELETRRKRTQTLKRAAKKGTTTEAIVADSAYNVVTMMGEPTGAGSTGATNGAGGGVGERDRDNLDIDMDLVTETEVIKVHMEQLKK